MFSFLMFPHAAPVSGSITRTVKRQIQPRCEHILILQRASQAKINYFLQWKWNQTKPFRNKAILMAKSARDHDREIFFVSYRAPLHCKSQILPRSSSWNLLESPCTISRACITKKELFFSSLFLSAADVIKNSAHSSVLKTASVFFVQECCV